MRHCAEFRLNSQAINISKNVSLILALIAIPLSGLSIDIYVPSLPAVSHYFGVDKALAQLSISAYMIGLGLMQLFAGSISDAFGRKKPFLIAIVAFMGISFLTPFVDSIYQLLLLRLLQGIAIAVVVVPMRSVASDLFEGDEFAKKNNYMFLAWSLGPIIAPAIGGYLQKSFGWQANFYFLGIYSLFTFALLSIFLPETSAHRHPFKLCASLKRYQSILRNKEYIFSLLTNGLLYSLIILFAVVGPFLVQTILHYSPEQFGHFALLSGLTWFIGGTVNRFLLHINYLKKSLIAFSIMLAISIVSLVINLHVGMNIYSVVLPIILLLAFGGIVFPNNFAKSITLFPKMTGSANALFGASIFLFAGFTSYIGTFLKSTTAVPLSIAYVVIVVLCLVVRKFNKNSI